MAMKELALAGVLATALVGAWRGDALAGPSDDTSTRAKPVWTFLGTTFCMPDAPADAACDLRLGATKPAADPAPAHRVVTLLGVDLCLGDVPATVDCDLRVPGDPTRARERTARR